MCINLPWNTYGRRSQTWRKTLSRTWVQEYVHIVQRFARLGEVDRMVDWHRVQRFGISSLTQERTPTQDEHGVQFGVGVLRPRGRIWKEVGLLHHSDDHVMTYSG
jgi:hypothetical protein